MMIMDYYKQSKAKKQRQQLEEQVRFCGRKNIIDLVLLWLKIQPFRFSGNRFVWKAFNRGCGKLFA